MRLSVPEIAVTLFLALVLAACGGEGGDKATETAATGSSTALDSSVSQNPLEIVGSTATDGICQITIPETWVDDGTGRGATAEGDRWVLFGGGSATDADWTSAKELLKSQYAGQVGAETDEDDSSVTITLANGRGYVVRQRFDQIYCEFSVSAVRDEPDHVTALWHGVAATLGPYKSP